MLGEKLINSDNGGEIADFSGKDAVAVKIEEGSADGVSPEKEVGPSSMVLEEKKGKHVIESINVEDMKMVRKRETYRRKCESKATKPTAILLQAGVDSVAIEDDERNLIVVVAEYLDVNSLVRLVRKRMGHAEICCDVEFEAEASSSTSLATRTPLGWVMFYYSFSPFNREICSFTGLISQILCSQIPRHLDTVLVGLDTFELDTVFGRLDTALSGLSELEDYGETSGLYCLALPSTVGSGKKSGKKDPISKVGSGKIRENKYANSEVGSENTSKDKYAISKVGSAKICILESETEASSSTSDTTETPKVVVPKHFLWFELRRRG